MYPTVKSTVPLGNAFWRLSLTDHPVRKIEIEARRWPAHVAGLSLMDQATRH